MDHKQEVSRLFQIEYGNRSELILRFSAILGGGLILYAYTGWILAIVWLGLYFLTHLVNVAFFLSRGTDLSKADSYVAGSLFLAILASFLWMPSYLMLQDDLALQVCGAAATASILVFLVQRSDTLWFMVVGEVAIIASAVLIALITTIHRVDFVLAQLAMIFCSFGMVGYVAYAIIQNRRVRLDKEEFEKRRNQALNEVRRSGDELQELKEILLDGIDTLPVGFAYFDENERLKYYNQNYRNYLPKSAFLLRSGLPFEELIRESAATVAPDAGYIDVEEYVQERRASPRGPRRIWTHQQSVGRWVTMTEHPTSSGGFISIIEDITEEKAQQERLHQAQKMEAVGQLTGGIAHDFNNLLAVIQGNAELIEDLEGEASSFIRSILRASQRGAELTQRLLAFSRKQSLKPEAVNLGALVSGMSDLLRRALGETIKIKTIVPGNVWLAMADRGQVENAILNLAINARDAMPSGGELTIECENLAHEDHAAAKNINHSDGEFVVLSVTDQGTGMTKEVQTHAFEPFFTTKDTGEGSGLGLSMVYGFARQSGGQVEIYSELSKGTTIKLYLPRAHCDGDQVGEPQKEPISNGGGETILVIEDDPQVRGLVEMMLEKLGYRVVSAENVDVARCAVKAFPEIILVISDVVLPGGTSGPKFAEELRSTHQGLKVIFMSGYPAEATTRFGSLGHEGVLLNKPFRIGELARALSEALN